MNDTTASQWLPVVGAEGCYDVSDRCEVRSLYRPGLILKPSYSNSGGYPLYLLAVDGQRVAKYGHQIVMEAFVGPCPEGQEVRHLDDDPRNNVLSNLVYGTHGENMADMLRNSGHHYGNRDACSSGHEFTPENTSTRTWPDGSFKQRICHTCENESARKYREKLKRTAPPCTEPGCDRPQRAKGLCGMHYQRQYVPPARNV